VRVGIVGLPLVGKSTIFNLLTHGNVDTSSWGGGKAEAHIGIAGVPDPRLEHLARIFQPKKLTHATVDYVDLPGWHRGEGGSETSYERNTYLHNLKNVDALLQVVRAFQDDMHPHPEGSVDPLRDIATFELEMILSDLSTVERRLERVSKDLKKSRIPELEIEHAVLERCRESLEKEIPLRELSLSGEEEKRIRGFTFLSAKPLLLVLNLGDADAAKVPEVVREYGLDRQASQSNVGITAVCGKIEAEIDTLPPEDAALFLEDLGLRESGESRIIRESFSLLRLLTFFTAAENEVRAWAIPRGSTALQAAGTIHSDFERGFIKAEVLSFDEMVRLGSFSAARNQGALRLEGKEYVVREGDVMLFRFNL
jgi:GTP-binding protein YchF